MAHLVAQFYDLPYDEAICMLEEAHEFLVKHIQASVGGLSTFSNSRWGILAKRLDVQLNSEPRPRLIEKESERFSEAVNMTATIERMIVGLHWFQKHEEFKHLHVKECHPSTSDDKKGGNDLVLACSKNQVVVRCEVCDVASSSAGANKKEKKDLQNLGCTDEVPQDGVHRFICTAKEFATALISPKRKWPKRAYRYKSEDASADTCMLRIIPRSEATAAR